MFTMISADRSVSGWRQFMELFKRNVAYLLRNPVSIKMTFIHASFVSLLVLALYFHVANVDLGDDLEGMKTR